MNNVETKFGECKICKGRTLLYSVVGSYKGQPWAGWICNNCYKMIKDNHNRRETEDGD